MAESNHLSDKELRLEILRLVKECGSEFQKKNPLSIADEYYNWVNRRGTIRKNPTGKKE